MKTNLNSCATQRHYTLTVKYIYVCAMLCLGLLYNVVVIVLCEVSSNLTYGVVAAGILDAIQLTAAILHYWTLCSNTVEEDLVIVNYYWTLCSNYFSEVSSI